MTQASLGRKFDSEKLRWDLLPLGLLKPVVKVLTLGARKYAPNNWKYVKQSRTRYYAAMMRHVEAHQSGQWLDVETNQPHLAHALCCLLFWFWHELRLHKWKD